jgi:hypothetical protein
VRVEALPISPIPCSISAETKNAENLVIRKVFGIGGAKVEQTSTKSTVPQCQPMAFGIIETIKSRYRYRLIQEIMDAFDERQARRKIADDAKYPILSRGLREGSVVNLCDAMRLLEGIWKEVANTTIIRSWQRTKLRLKNVLPQELEPKRGTRAKSEKRQTTREKKQLVEDLQTFLIKNEVQTFVADDGSNQIENDIEKLKNCFLYSDGTMIPQREFFDALEDWICLEESGSVVRLFIEELKEEMDIPYLVGLKDMTEKTIPEAEEAEETELEQLKIKNTNAKTVELDFDTAMELAATIKSTAVKLFGNGNILGELACKLDDAADGVFCLLRKQKEAAKQKLEAEMAKASKKNHTKRLPNLENADENDNIASLSTNEDSAAAQLDESGIAGVDIGDIDGIAVTESV